MNNKIMTLGIFAHANAGKTTITEQLLYHTNVKKSIGRVDHGDTTTDNLTIERERGISVRASLVTLPLKDRIVQLIDTPGHVDFSAEVERAISVLDGAVLVVSGVEGVEPQTQVIWKILQERHVPTLIFINKMDRMGADYERTLKELRSKLSDDIFPMVNVKKDLKTNQLSYEDIKFEHVIENIANIDDHVLEKYLSEEKISREWLENQIHTLTNLGSLHFVYGGSALNDDGILRLIEGIEKYLPCSGPKKSDDFSGYVYTVKRDNAVRELYVKVLDGELHNRQEFVDKYGNKQKIRTVTKLQGSSRKKTDVLETGEIGIITGLSAQCGEIIGKNDEGFKTVTFVNPLFHTTVSIEDNSKVSELANALEILNDEDPDLHLRYNKATNQVSIDLMGPLQAEIIGNMLQERFSLNVNFSTPIIIHKETPISTGYGKTSFDRVSSVEFKIEPLPLGSGLQYESKVSTDYLFAKYQKQIERLIKMYSKQGLYGWEITDAKITLIDGKSDSVCSDPSHYNVAVPIALMRSVKDACMQLLEPVMKYEISIPKEDLEKIISATGSMGVEYENISERDGNYLIPGSAPLSRILDFPSTITRLTSGHGSMIRKPNGFVLKSDGKIIEREYSGPDPRNESLFLMDINSSPDHLDRISKRR